METNLVQLSLKYAGHLKILLVICTKTQAIKVEKRNRKKEGHNKSSQSADLALSPGP